MENNRSSLNLARFFEPSTLQRYLCVATGRFPCMRISAFVDHIGQGVVTVTAPPSLTRHQYHPMGSVCVHHESV